MAEVFTSMLTVRSKTWRLQRKGAFRIIYSDSKLKKKAVWIKNSPKRLEITEPPVVNINLVTSLYLQ